MRTLDKIFSPQSENFYHFLVMVCCLSRTSEKCPVIPFDLASGYDKKMLTQWI